MSRLFITALTVALLTTGCSESAPPAESTQPEPTTVGAPEPAIPVFEDRTALFGDLHVHTRYSFDAFIFGTRTDPDESYAFAKGGAIKHASGISVQMKKPLDFQAVTDHGTYLGMLPQMWDPESGPGKHPLSTRMRETTDPVKRREVFNEFLPRIGGLIENDDLLDLNVVRSAWHEIAASAERNYEPGKFTTFIAYEYTAGGPDFENLHRNVIFEGSQFPDMPYTRLNSVNPETLWDWMDGQRDQGIEALAIPHNSNGSNGWMFQRTDWNGTPIDATYAEQRMRNEPLVEITQVKGTSDTHPLLSPNDEWADFEIMPVRIASTLASQPNGSYVREAWLNGLAMEAENGANPYRFGVIGSSDTHNSAGSFEEDNYWSKTGMLDIKPEQRGSVPVADAEGNLRYNEDTSGYWGASGLAGVWAESNTRESIYAAFRRKETFATSGPHIRVRFFAGYDLAADIAQRSDAVGHAYDNGVTMGADLLADGDRSPRFFTWASRDPDTAPLQRIQIIKGWLEDGETREAVFDVACSNGASADPATHRCPDNGARVDITNCAQTGDAGAAELSAAWSDPTFDPAQRAFYYVRVLENPTCRWSTWDAVRAGTPPNPKMHATIQDRAWSSPIWYVPAISSATES